MNTKTTVFSSWSQLSRLKWDLALDLLFKSGSPCVHRKARASSHGANMSPTCTMGSRVVSALCTVLHNFISALSR